jgi:hypothetical protein
VLPSTSLTEEGVESIITSPNSLVTGHLAIRLNTIQTWQCYLCRLQKEII